MEDKSKQDINGKESAKRKWSSRLLWNSLAGFWVLVAVAIGFHVKGVEIPENFVPEFLREMWIWITVGGFGALGLTIFEILNKYLKKD